MNEKFALWLLGQADFALAEGNSDLHMFLTGLHTGLMYRIQAEDDLDMFSRRQQTISRDMATIDNTSNLKNLFTKGKYMGFVNLVDIAITADKEEYKQTVD